jgi:hypothetical protein
VIAVLGGPGSKTTSEGLDEAGVPFGLVVACTRAWTGDTRCPIAYNKCFVAISFNHNLLDPLEADYPYICEP